MRRNRLPMILSSIQFLQGLQQLLAHDVAPKAAEFPIPSIAFVFQFEGALWHWAALPLVVFQIPLFKFW